MTDQSSSSVEKISFLRGHLRGLGLLIAGNIVVLRVKLKMRSENVFGDGRRCDLTSFEHMDDFLGRRLYVKRGFSVVLRVDVFCKKNSIVKKYIDQCTNHRWLPVNLVHLQQMYL